jgi:hypothetical protein
LAPVITTVPVMIVKPVSGSCMDILRLLEKRPGIDIYV